MTSEEFNPPEWLPDGWIMEVRRGDDGTIHKYYTCPIYDYMFCTEKEVMLYLKMMNDGCVEHETFEDVENEYSQEVIEESVQIVRRTRNLVEWMPRGWVMEIKKQEDDEDKRCKCYFDRSTGFTFYSKEEALQFLQSGNAGSHSAYLKRRRVSDSNVIAQIEYSPNGVPPGWIREITFKGVKGSNTIRKDSYYLDPDSGFAFRSKKEVALFTEQGIACKYAFRPRRYGIFDMQCVGSMEAPKTKEIGADGRHLGNQIPKPGLIRRIDEQPETPHRIMDGKDNGKRKMIDQATEQEDELLSCRKEKGNKMVEKLFKASENMSTPPETFFKKTKSGVSQIVEANVSKDTAYEQSCSVLPSLSQGNQLSSNAEAPEKKLQNESHKDSSNGHDLDIGKAVILTTQWKMSE